jgi:hypothetical protein
MVFQRRSRGLRTNHQHRRSSTPDERIRHRSCIPLGQCRRQIPGNLHSNTLVPLSTQLTTNRAGLAPWLSSMTPEILAAVPFCPLRMLDTLNWVQSPAVAGWMLTSAASAIPMARIWHFPKSCRPTQTQNGITRPHSQLKRCGAATNREVPPTWENGADGNRRSADAGAGLVIEAKVPTRTTLMSR